MAMNRNKKNLLPSGLYIYAILYLSFIYIPVLFLPLFSFNDSKYVSFPLKGLTLTWYQDMINNPSMINALINSLKIGLIVSFVSTILGLLTAKAVTKYRLPGKLSMVGFMLTPLVIPEIILGISLLILLSMFNVSLSLMTVGFAHLLICVPFSILILIARLDNFDKNIEEASLDLGENSWMTFWLVTFPIILPGIVASLLLTFTISFDEFVLAFFLSSAEQTLPIYIWSSLRFPTKLPATLALGATIFFTSFLVIAFSEWLRKRGVKSETHSSL